MREPAPPPENPPSRVRPIPTFHARHGRITDGMRRVLVDHLDAHRVDPSRPFERPTVVEVGAGSGTAALAYAAHHPDHDVIAAEVHTPGVVQLLRAVVADAVSNVSVHHGDAVALLDHLPPASVAGVHLLFPDPWPKTRHHKRRFIRPDNLDRIARVLADGAPLVLATDVDAYVAWADDHVASHPAFGAPSAERPPWRPSTAYEARGRRLGHRIHDRSWRRVPRPG